MSMTYRALQAPVHEKTLRGRNLKISPADSWHQPTEDADGRGRWKPRGQRRADGNTSSSENGVQEHGIYFFPEFSLSFLPKSSLFKKIEAEEVVCKSIVCSLNNYYSAEFNTYNSH